MISNFCKSYLALGGVQILDPVPAAATKPAELAPNERRDPTDPYCPKWCRYACTGAWMAGQCLIRIPEATKAIMTRPAEPVQICKKEMR
jgi:hypothetical protein